MLSTIEKYYNKHKEDLRLERRHGLVEYRVAMKYIHDYLPTQAEFKKQFRILDVGAGTGKYTLALQEEGYSVQAVELVQHNIDVMRQHCPSVNVVKGNALDLHFIEDNQYDMVIFFGPLYHLVQREDRIQALSEAKRVAKPGAVILSAYVMNDYSILTYCFEENRMAELIRNGHVDEQFHVRSTGDELYDYARIEDINSLNECVGLERITLFSPDGASDYMRPRLNAMDEENFELYIRYQLSIAERTDLIGAGSHVVDITRVIK